ncbi:MAG: arsenate reductase ArsC [Candidatus Hodarchaeales archaeon]
MSTKKIEVLFICTHNSARSQMAEGYLSHVRGNDFNVYSAGTRPSKVSPYAIIVMSEKGIDISCHKSKHVQLFLNKKFDYIITVCDSAKEECPHFPGEGVRIHKSFPDPTANQRSQDEILVNFRNVRDEIFLWIDSFFQITIL